MRNPILLLLAVVSFILFSCSPQNLFVSKVTKSAPDSLFTHYADGFEHKIKPDDKLTISIWNHDDLSVGSTFGIYNSNEVYGKWVLVDKLGNTMIPVLGKLHVEGMTARELADTLTVFHSTQLVHPIIVVKILNRQVTVLGEVIHPASHVLEKEKYGILEMIGRSGGFDTYADKKHITIVRQVGKETKKTELDFTKLSEYEIHNFVVEANDIIYVPTRKAKVFDKRATSIIPFAGLVTAVVVLISFLGKQ
jgi:polysaccharide export outer membrane protein